MSAFIRADYVLAAIGIATAGATALAAELYHAESKRKLPGEPLRSLTLFMIYIPLGYAVTPLLSKVLNDRDSQRVFVFLSVLALLFHFLVLASLRLGSGRGSPTTQLALEPSAIANATAITATACSSPEQYRDLIVPAEASASNIDRIPKRISVVFKDLETVQHIALQRFGSGSASIDYYVDEHKQRAAEFFAALGRGMICREIYSIQEVEDYVQSRRHGASVVLSPDQMRRTLIRWKDVIAYQPNYFVAFTREKLPFKYEVINRKLVVIHEAIGENDRNRLNAIAMDGSDIAHEFSEDFETIWDRIPPEDRNRQFAVAWIEQHLIHLLEQAAA